MKPMMTLRKWQRIDRPGALVGFAHVSLPFGRTRLEIDDCPVLVSHGKAWASWPGRPVLTPQGTLARIPGTSKPHYQNLIRCRDRDISTRFSQAVVRLVRAADPTAFADRETGRPASGVRKRIARKRGAVPPGEPAPDDPVDDLWRDMGDAS